MPYWANCETFEAALTLIRWLWQENGSVHDKQRAPSRRCGGDARCFPIQRYIQAPGWPDRLFRPLHWPCLKAL